MYVKEQGECNIVIVILINVIRSTCCEQV